MAPGDVVPKKEQDKVFSDFKDEEIQRLRAALQETQTLQREVHESLVVEERKHDETRGRLRSAESDVKTTDEWLSSEADKRGVPNFYLSEGREVDAYPEKRILMALREAEEKLAESQARCAGLGGGLGGGGGR